jgi:uncharacterized protein (TIGR01777 family)
MKVVITGATGFIGTALCEELKSDYEIVALSRNKEKAMRVLENTVKIVQWDGETTGDWANELEGAFCVINLAGENIGVKRWTEKKKERIINSRIKATAAVVDAIRKSRSKPKVLIQASAMGWYGSKGTIEADEDSGPGEGFLAKVSQQGENTAEQVTDMNVRLAKMRFGAVLGLQGGVLTQMIKPFKFYLGGYLGNGRQWFPWVSIDDVVGAVRFVMENEKCSGAFNVTGPVPIELKDFCTKIGAVMNQSSWTIIPGFLVKLILGQMGEELLLTSYKIKPKKLMDAGYEFRHRIAQEALKDIIK